MKQRKGTLLGWLEGVLVDQSNYMDNSEQYRQCHGHVEMLR